MANKEYNGNYKETATYKKADSATKTKIERFRKENKINEKHMYLLLLREDLRSLPKEEKQKGNRPAEIIVITGIITFLAMTAADRKDLLPFAAAYMIFASVIYFSGILNPVARELSNINKLLKKFPDVPSLKEYLEGKKEEE